MNIISEAFQRHKDLVEKLNSIVPDVEKGAEILVELIKSGKKLLVCGNGGSAADAQHFAGSEFLGRYHEDRRPLPAIALVADSCALTTIANDYGYEHVFSRQVEALGAAGDVLVAITTSGKSPNILRAIEAAKKKGMKTIALTGERGAELKSAVDLAVVVPSSETARIQEVHELVIHTWCEAIDQFLKSG